MSSPRRPWSLLTVAASVVSVAVNAQTLQRTSGDCSPIITDNRGNITINCTDKQLEQRLRSVIDTSIQSTNSKLSTLQDATSRQVANLRNAEEEAKRKQASLETVVNRAREANEKNVLQLNELRQSSQMGLDALSSGLDSLKGEFQLSTEFTNSLVYQAREKLGKDFDAVYIRVDSIENRVNLLTFRVVELESNVHLIMSRFMDGSLSESVYFAGLHIGKGQVDALRPTEISLEGEVLTRTGSVLPDNYSIYASVGRTSSDYRSSFRTFDGANPIVFTDSNSGTRVTTGYRSFHGVSPRHLWYYGLEISYYRIPSNPVRTSVGFGVNFGGELPGRSSRTALQLGIHRVPVRRTEFAFNPVGDSSSAPATDYKTGLFADFRVSFR